MSFLAISEALKSRLTSIPGVGHVYVSEKWSRDNPESDAFKAAFCDENGILNYWVIEQTARRTQRVKGERTRRKCHRDWLINVVYAWSSTDQRYGDFQALLDRVCDSFEEGDRTLGGACHTHTDPDAVGIRLTTFTTAARLTVNHAQLKITTEEIV